MARLIVKSPTNALSIEIQGVQQGGGAARTAGTDEGFTREKHLRRIARRREKQYNKHEH